MSSEASFFKFSECSKFLDNLLTMMREGVISEGLVRTLPKLKTNYERVSLIYKHIVPYLGQLGIKEEGKNDLMAEKFRDYGDQKFENRQFREALNAYTRSVAAANSREVLAKAYAHRSDLFHSLRMQQDCAADIIRALNNEYPLHLSRELFYRLSRLPELEVFNLKHHEPIPVIPSSERHAHIKNATKSITIQQDDQMFTHVIATRHIKAGRILAIEKPFVSKVHTRELDHCHKCFKLCYSLIPCNNCTTAFYCTKVCRDSADELYHKYECVVLLLAKRIGLTPDDILPFRMIFRARSEYWKLQYLEGQIIHSLTHRSDRYLEMHNLFFRLPSQIIEESQLEILNEIYKLSPNGSIQDSEINLGAVRNLCNEINYVKPDLLSQTVRCAIVYHFLKNFTDFFDIPPQYPEHLEKMFMETSMRFSEVCQRSATGIYEMTQYNLDGFFPTEIGQGVYALANIFSHSCHPNVMAINYGSTRVYYSMRSIKVGEECFVSLSQMEHDFQESDLEKIYFCQASMEGSPQMKKYEIKTNFGRSSRIVNLLKKLPQVSNIAEARALLPTILRGLSQTEDHAPCWEFYELKRALYRCYSFFGNLKKSL